MLYIGSDFFSYLYDAGIFPSLHLTFDIMYEYACATVPAFFPMRSLYKQTVIFAQALFFICINFICNHCPSSRSLCLSPLWYSRSGSYTPSFKPTLCMCVCIHSVLKHVIRDMSSY